MSSHYAFGLSECKTLGHYADKQSKIYGKEKCQKMSEDFVTKKDGGMDDLPTGMSRINDHSETNKNSLKNSQWLSSLPR